MLNMVLFAEERKAFYSFQGEVICVHSLEFYYSCYSFKAITAPDYLCTIQNKLTCISKC